MYMYMFTDLREWEPREWDPGKGSSWATEEKLRVFIHVNVSQDNITCKIFYYNYPLNLS